LAGSVAPAPRVARLFPDPVVLSGLPGRIPSAGAGFPDHYPGWEWPAAPDRPQNPAEAARHAARARLIVAPVPARIRLLDPPRARLEQVVPPGPPGRCAVRPAPFVDRRFAGAGLQPRAPVRKNVAPTLPGPGWLAREYSQLLEAGLVDGWPVALQRSRARPVAGRPRCAGCRARTATAGARFSVGPAIGLAALPGLPESRQQVAPAGFPGSDAGSARHSADWPARPLTVDPSGLAGYATSRSVGTGARKALAETRKILAEDL